VHNRKKGSLESVFSVSNFEPSSRTRLRSFHHEQTMCQVPVAFLGGRLLFIAIHVRVRPSLPWSTNLLRGDLASAWVRWLDSGLLPMTLRSSWPASGPRCPQDRAAAWRSGSWFPGIAPRRLNRFNRGVGCLLPGAHGSRSPRVRTSWSAKTPKMSRMPHSVYLPMLEP
jgi:hypothetical protein